MSGLEGVLCRMDDILIWGSNEAEYIDRLSAVMKQIEGVGVTQV